MKKTLLVLLSLSFISISWANTPTVTRTIVSTITPTVTRTFTTPVVLPTATITPTPMSAIEMQVWKDKLNPIKPLKNVKPFLSIFSKPVVTEKNVYDYIKVAPTSEIIAIKTKVAIKEAEIIAIKPTLTPTKAPDIKPTATKEIIKEIIEVIKK